MTPMAALARVFAHRGRCFFTVLVLTGILGAVSGCRSSSDPPALVPVSAPGTPINLTANVGTQTLSIGWDAPPDNGGSAILDYEVQIVPTVAAANSVVSGTRALFRNLTAGT